MKALERVTKGANILNQKFPIMVQPKMLQLLASVHFF